MPTQLDLIIGQHSSPGIKPSNQDFHGFCLPSEPLRTTKGIPVGLADGISSSDVSQVAAETVVKAFLNDYFCTSEAWTVKHSVFKVLAATNYWLHSMSRQSRYLEDQDKGYVCTFSGLVFKSATAHLFHIGDTRVYRLRGSQLDLLTEDHQLRVTSRTSYLTRAIGFHTELEIDYRSLVLEPGDVFILLSDGVYDFVDDDSICRIIDESCNDLDAAAKMLVDTAVLQKSDDNLTAQIVRVVSVPATNSIEVHADLIDLPFPPQLSPRDEFDGFRIVRELHASSRSHVYLVSDLETGDLVVMKTLSTEQQQDPGHLNRFFSEEWVARRLNNVNVLKAYLPSRKRKYLYTITEYIDGQTLTQWMRDNPLPPLDVVRGIVQQIGKGLQAFHRQEMLHQDIRPENILIDREGTVKIIDFGSTWVAGLAESTSQLAPSNLLGTVQYMAPEVLRGEAGTPRSEVFSLAVITYQMLTGRLPYGPHLARTRTRAAQSKLRYATAITPHSDLPGWIDGTLAKALHLNANLRYEEPAEFVYDLYHPRKEFIKEGQPLLIRDPATYWKRVSAVLACILAAVCGAWLMTLQ
ncbi:bifunctional protein-serine/threonine kinase/phosphatase [Allorhodopirellula heiligendammensis]|uniref:Serine/threonine-protein kinase PrkC n=1 Tax=Allorhodopirellula heiligendammensis TaxID=2714739 RepID=A0A5C6C1Y9_9BACT|nr:bifunctional protein-serine/threonine kinase/phosphatase [Allorhodopirellula heiligendammensis]TWU18105.1 Serine/threonine-protein kinase PrkC [Allorhodopirellula heiligendammensis]